MNAIDLPPNFIWLGASCFLWSLSGMICSAVGFPLTFSVNADPSAVALQFDVSQEGFTSSLDEPVFNGASPHKVESDVVGSGATRFVIYSTTAQPISPSGQIEVTFDASDLSDGMLTISGVMASNADGLQTTASPNSLPIIIPHAKDYRSQEVGTTMLLAATAYDLDGSVVSMTFSQDNVSISSVSSVQPGSVLWAPATNGLQELSVSASDNAGGDTTIDLGVIHAYQQSELASFSDFEAIHFGSAANPADLGFATTAFGSDLPNGLAWLLGINPHAPDPAKLPSGTVETTGSDEEFVFRFNRLDSTHLDGHAWQVLESTDLTGNSWEPVPGAWLSETPVGDGTIDVEVRKPLDFATEPQTFLTLQASQTP